MDENKDGSSGDKKPTSFHCDKGREDWVREGSLRRQSVVLQ